MRDAEPRSFALVEDDELPADVLNFVKLFRVKPDPPDLALRRTPVEGDATSGPLA